VAATVAGVTTRGLPWNMRVVSAHLDNMVGPRRGWVAGAEYARARQARGLVSLLDERIPTILAGDFNTWFGFSDQAYRETVRAFPQTRVSDRRPTFLGILRLDHLFFRLPDGWQAEFRREDERYGSDHYPLVATIRF
jgi:endonuclease/exonuclease/phosphatase family metal-dependent hydrolase